MFKGIDTQNAYQTCLQRGFCQEHSSQLPQDDSSKNNNEFLRKAILFIRINVLDPIYFKKFHKCGKVKVILQKTKYFSECISGSNIPVQAFDSILILDSIAVFTLCHLSKICCIGALFKYKAKLKTEDPELKLLYNLLHTEQLQESDISHLNPLLQKNFIGCDLNLIKVCYASTLLFVRNVCVKLNIQAAVEAIEKEINKTGWQQKQFKLIGDTCCERKEYDDGLKIYSKELNMNPFQVELLVDRAMIYNNTGRYKEAQMDSYIAMMIEPKCCKAYLQLSSALCSQYLYKEGLEILNAGLGMATMTEENKEAIINIKAKLESSLNSMKKIIDVSNNKNKISHTNEIQVNNSFPDLIEASDSSESSDTEEKLPELIDGSDSDESETVKIKQPSSPLKNKKNTSRKKRNIPQVLPDLKDEEKPLENSEINVYLKEASEAILEDCGFKSLQIFRGPLRNFIESIDTTTEFQECEIVCIKYAYGFAYCISGEYDDLQKSILIFKEIIEKYESINFPAAYYALGLTYRKLNRFRDALCYLEKVKNILSKGIHFKVYSWPGMVAVIKETKSEVLNELVNNLIEECENPPNPDAICRYAECEFQQPIYYTDPDFKGYISLTCSDQCCLQYHVQCWKALKTVKELTDKEFLEEPCFTPDCDGITIKVQHIDKKGDVSKEFLSDTKKGAKNRWAKWEKKPEVKEKKRKKTTNNKPEESSQDGSVDEKNHSRKNSYRRESESAVECPVSSTNQAEIEELKNNDVKKNESSSNIPKSSESIHYEIISRSSAQSQLTSNVEISKESSTINDSKATSETAQTIFSGSIKQNSFFSSSVPKFQETDTSTTDQIKSENLNKSIDLVSNSIKKNVYSYMADFLQLHGPLKVDDPKLLNELSIFPEETLKTIKECGGIGEFLKNDLSFAYVGDIYVCVISDVGIAYQMLANSSFPSEIKNLDSLETSDSFKQHENSAYTYTLNPDAREYKPSKSSNKNNTYNNNINPFFKSTQSYVYGHPLYKVPPPTMNKLAKNQIPCNLFISRDFAKNTRAVDSNLNMSPSLSYSTPSLCPKKIVVSNDGVTKTFHCEEPKKSLESQSSKVNFTVLNSNNSIKAPPTELKEAACKSEKNEIKDVKEFGDTLIELIKLYFSKMAKHQQEINSHIKPYIIKKATEVSNAACLTDKSEENISAELTENDRNNLLAETEKLIKQNKELEIKLHLIKEQAEDSSEEVLNLKKSLDAALLELKIIKEECAQKEEDMINKRKDLYDNLKDAYETIDKQRKGAEVLKTENANLQKALDNLKLSLQEVEKCKKTELEAQQQEHAVKIQNLEKKNEELKNRAKNAELQILNIKKTEFLKKIEEKKVEASKRRKEVTDGLSLVSSSLNPLFKVSITTLAAQLTTYISDLDKIKVNFVAKIDKQIAAINSGAALNELEEIPMISLPEMPSIEKTLTANAPSIDKTLLSGNQPSLSTFGTATAQSTAGLPLSNVMIPPVPSVLPPSIPTTFFPQSVSPFSNPLPLATNASLPVSLDTKNEMLTKNDSVTLLDLNHLQKSLSSSTSSINSSTRSTLPSPDCTLDDKVSHKNLQGFEFPNSSTNSSAKLAKIPTVPPGIQTTTVSDFSKAPGTVTAKPLKSESNSNASSMNGGLDTIVKVPEEEKKKTAASNKNSYEKLLNKLKDQFPEYTQEQLISFVKEFRMQRKGKLTGLPIDSIICQIGAMINLKKVEKKVPPKGLVNKKLVPEPKPKDPSPEPTTVKKKCAWGVVDSSKEKKWSGKTTVDDECVICSEDMNSTNAYKVPCGHLFHEKCIRQWLQLKSDCPVCRVLLLLPEDYPSLS